MPQESPNGDIKTQRGEAVLDYSARGAHKNFIDFSYFFLPFYRKKCTLFWLAAEALRGGRIFFHGAIFPPRWAPGVAIFIHGVGGGAKFAATVTSSTALTQQHCTLDYQSHSAHSKHAFSVRKTPHMCSKLCVLAYFGQEQLNG